MGRWIQVGILLLAAGCSRAPPPVAAGAMEAAASAAPADVLAVVPTAPRWGSGGPVGTSLDRDAAVLAAWSRDWRRAARAHALVLAGRADGRSQLAAAWLLRMSVDDGDGNADAMHADDAAYAALLVRAGELAPDDPLVAWLERMDCPTSQSACRPAQALARLQRLDPDNAAVWLAGLDDALKSGDRAAVDAALERAARAGRYDDHWDEVGRFLDTTLAAAALPGRSVAVMAAQRRQAGAGAPTSDDEERSLQALAMAAAVATPGLSGLTSSCGVADASSASAARRSACLAVFSHMAASDTLLARGIGLGSAVRLTAGTPEGAAWQERQRNFLWLRNQAIAHLAMPPPGYAKSLWRDGEVATMQALLAAAGHPLTPPPGWCPPQRSCPR